jgi:hypothetical protein
MDKVLSEHVFVFNTFDSSGESLVLKTKFISNGDNITENEGVYVNQELTLSSYCNSASFNLFGATITPEKLRNLANQLETERNKIVFLNSNLCVSPQEAFDILQENPNHKYKSEYELIIQKDPHYAYYYAKDIIKGRWKEGEESIKKDPKLAYLYAKNILKDRWKEGEETIKKDPRCACYYAREVIKHRWIEGEESIKAESYTAYYYAKNVIKGRWKECEETIKKDTYYAYIYAKYVIKDKDFWENQ